MSIQVTINGRQLELPEPLTLETYLQEKGLIGRRLAIAHNSQVVPSDRFAHTVINDGDTLEIVRPVGGG